MLWIVQCKHKIIHVCSYICKVIFNLIQLVFSVYKWFVQRFCFIYDLIISDYLQLLNFSNCFVKKKI